MTPSRRPPVGSLVALPQQLWPEDSLLVTGLVVQDNLTGLRIAPVHPEVERATDRDLLVAPERTGLGTRLVVVGRLAASLPPDQLPDKVMPISGPVVEEMGKVLALPPGHDGAPDLPRGLPGLGSRSLRAWQKRLDKAWGTFRDRVWAASVQAAMAAEGIAEAASLPEELLDDGLSMVALLGAPAPATTMGKESAPMKAILFRQETQEDEPDVHRLGKPSTPAHKATRAGDRDALCRALREQLQSLPDLDPEIARLLTGDAADLLAALLYLLTTRSRRG